MEEGGRPPGPGPDDRSVLGNAAAKDPGAQSAAGNPKRGVRRRGRSSWAWKALGVSKIGFEVAVLAAAIWLFVFRVSIVSGHSMDPSLEAGDRLVVDRIGYQWGPLRRFDMVVFECPDSPAGQPRQRHDRQGADLGTLVSRQAADRTRTVRPDRSEQREVMRLRGRIVGAREGEP